LVKQATESTDPVGQATIRSTFSLVIVDQSAYHK